jgi:hypothetical protein
MKVGSACFIRFMSITLGRVLEDGLLCELFISLLLSHPERQRLGGLFMLSLQQSLQ